MNSPHRSIVPACCIVLACGMTLTGCGKAPVADPAAQAQPAADTAGHKDGDGHEHAKGEHQHGAWWCDDHGVPEAECARCNSKIAAAFQKKGDWCKQHDRPDSQCFICHPEKLEEYAARYEAKIGRKPPQPELN